MKPMSEAHFAILRQHMVEVIEIQVDLASEELGKAALNERVLAAMRKVPRHRFVPSFLAPLAYQDTPLPIGFDKTISQPFIVALMTDLLDPEPHDSILEVGTGLGYQAAIRVRLDSIRRFEGRQARPANAEFDLSRRDGLRHHLGRRRGLGIFADRQWRILQSPIDLAMGDTRANQNNETDNGGEVPKSV